MKIYKGAYHDRGAGLHLCSRDCCDATIEDITINNILFVDRKAKKAMNVFDGLASAVPEKVPNLDRIETLSIEDFLAKSCCPRQSRWK